MPVSERQREAFADTHAWRIPFDTSPRYLAGPGDGRHVTHGLAAAGWIRTSDPLSPEIVLTSPDKRYRLQFDPQSATSAWWRLWAEPTNAKPWYAEFGELVPAEILAGLTDALIGPPPSEQPNPVRSLGWAGWVIEAQNSAVSLDGMCHVEQRTSRVNGSAPHWHIETAEPLAGRLGARDLARLVRRAHPRTPRGRLRHRARQPRPAPARHVRPHRAPQRRAETEPPTHQAAGPRRPHHPPRRAPHTGTRRPPPATTGHHHSSSPTHEHVLSPAALTTDAAGIPPHRMWRGEDPQRMPFAPIPP